MPSKWAAERDETLSLRATLASECAAIAESALAVGQAVSPLMDLVFVAAEPRCGRERGNPLTCEVKHGRKCGGEQPEPEKGMDGLPTKVKATEIKALVPASEKGSEKLSRPILTPFNRFSAAPVYRALNRLVAAVESVFHGETRVFTVARDQADKARLAEQSAQGRIETIARLAALKEQLSAGARFSELKWHTSRMPSDFLGSNISDVVSAKKMQEKSASVGSLALAGEVAADNSWKRTGNSELQPKGF